MKIKTLSIPKARSVFEEWIRDKESLPSIAPQYRPVRTRLHSLYAKAKEQAEETKDTARKNYLTDLYFGLAVYDYLQKQPWFSLRLASDPDFWRYLTTCVIPDTVDERWKGNPKHFYELSARNYLQSLWWYIYLSLQKDKDGNPDLQKTKETLEYPEFNSDTIVNLTERSGRKGTWTEANRNIMKLFSQLDSAAARAGSNRGSAGLFRSIMKLHTAKSVVVDPDLYPGGPEKYAESLFRDLNMPVEKAEEDAGAENEAAV